MVAAGHRSGSAGRMADKRGVERRQRATAVSDGERKQPECAGQYPGAGSSWVLPQAGLDRLRQAMVRHERVCAANDSRLWQHAEEWLLWAGVDHLRCITVA